MLDSNIALTYHAFDDQMGPLYIDPKEFNSHLRMLKSCFLVRSETEAKLPAKLPAGVLTAHDGYESVFTKAFPLLKKYDMPLTVFLITSRIGWPGYLKFSQIAEMCDSRLVSFQSHGHMTHMRNANGRSFVLRQSNETLDEHSRRLSHDVKVSAEIIEGITNLRPDTFCFPFGQWNSKVWNIIRSTGFDYHSTNCYYLTEKNPVIDASRISAEQIKDSISQRMLNWI